MYSEIADLVNEGLVIKIILLNIFQSFDVVCHVVLLDKLRDIEIVATLFNWIWRFLLIVPCVSLWEEPSAVLGARLVVCLKILSLVLFFF